MTEIKLFTMGNQFHPCHNVHSFNSSFPSETSTSLIASPKCIKYLTKEDEYYAISISTLFLLRSYGIYSTLQYNAVYCYILNHRVVS